MLITTMPAYRWNERTWGTVPYVKALSAALSAAGFETKLVLGDSASLPPVMDHTDDPVFTASFDVVGMHYPCTASRLDKQIWSTEDWWTEANFGGAIAWAELLNRNWAPVRWPV
jgi:hypothetical protein